MTEKNETLDPEQKAKWDAGVAAAKQAMAESDRPIMLMDEMPGVGLEPDIEAMGWNSVWASEENSARWTASSQNTDKV
ncbi:hypothetical protein [Microbulbifer epialgicus]|uniref:Uncharacterized protein n=1 Tax=Microbulbifer epialgicus TaxID=393907 RepID=A0ABV4NV83_9GAMM